MEDSGFDRQELRHAQYGAAVDVSELPVEWELLKPIRGELEAWKAAHRDNVHKRMEAEAAGKVPPLSPGQIVGQKIFHICVDRPQEEERITMKLHRHFYEREYVRVTKLIKEVKLPVTVEVLSRRRVLGDGRPLENGEGPPVPPLDLAALSTHPSGPNDSGIASEGSNALLPPRMSTGEGDARGNGGLQRRKSSRKLFKSLSNPFKDFVQPPQPGAELSSAPQLQGPEEERKPKRKSGLRWCFAAPFTQAGDTPQWHRTQPNVEMLSQASDRNSLPGPLPTNWDRASRDLDAGRSSLQSSQKDKDNANGGVGAGSGRIMTPHEAAVRAALQAGAADESQHETFTQLEEEAVTIETTERFLKHRYYQREYILLVIYKGEKRLPQYYETLSRERYLLPGTEVAAASATS